VPPRGGQPAVVLHQDRVAATLPRQASKRRRHSWSGRVVVAHPRSGGNCGWARHGRLRQWWWWPQETRFAPAVARGAIIYSDDSHVRRGWLWHDSMTNSSDQVASVASFDLVASGSSSVDKLSDPCLCHRWSCFMSATYTICAFQWWFLRWWIQFMFAIKLSLIPVGLLVELILGFFINYATRCIYLCDFV
jgi:hypothetical protein